MPFSGEVPSLLKSFGLEQQFLRSYYCEEHHPQAHLQDLCRAGMLMMAMVLALYYSLAALLVVDFLSPENCLHHFCHAGGQEVSPMVKAYRWICYLTENPVWIPCLDLVRMPVCTQ